MHTVRKTQFGFTLIEILTVVGIIGILISISSISLGSIQKRSRDNRRILDIKELQTALQQYHTNQPGGFYPTTMTILVTEKYLEKLPLDPLTKTAAPYGYTRLPAGCNNTANRYCLNYQLSITLESGVVHRVGPRTYN
ncbi:MAG: prepilin-type N-terminal cleavage/methylation domain-containing protein [bacterium]|nr:prepilin-type N-terminal cleavage/methylation domain-containing protein [bacterium]